jgi:PIN domain nuclease of toxin-antitoxin system
VKPAPILLDTCAAIWTTSAGSLSEEAEAVLSKATAQSAPVLVSPITAWEVGQLVAKARLVLSEDPKSWFAGLLESGVSLAELTPEILIDASFLPSCTLRDPADRILAATARVLGCRLMTRDGPILQYGGAGWIKTLAC